VAVEFAKDVADVALRGVGADHLNELASGASSLEDLYLELTARAAA
jgi:hypothetical protein